MLRIIESEIITRFCFFLVFYIYSDIFKRFFIVTSKYRSKENVTDNTKTECSFTGKSFGDWKCILLQLCISDKVVTACPIICPIQKIRSSMNHLFNFAELNFFHVQKGFNEFWASFFQNIVSIYFYRVPQLVEKWNVAANRCIIFSPDSRIITHQLPHGWQLYIVQLTVHGIISRWFLCSTFGPTAVVDFQKSFKRYM